MFAKSTIVLGGAASGKSQWAETLMESSGLNLIYLATGRIWDDEIEKRVAVHQSRRDTRWTTVEAPLDLGPSLAELTPADAVLIDCATMWLSNQMIDEIPLAGAQTRLMQALETCQAPWVVVTNEVGHGIVPDNKLARDFREAQGRLNIALAARAELAVQITAGLPQVLKGTLP